MLRQGLLKQISDFLCFVSVVDLVSTNALAYPGLGYPLCVSYRNALIFEREVASGGCTCIEVLVVPHIGRHNHRSYLPVEPLWLRALGPH